jgi:hypothetical protein
MAAAYVRDQQCRGLAETVVGVLLVREADVSGRLKGFARSGAAAISASTKTPASP